MRPSRTACEKYIQHHEKKHAMELTDVVEAHDGDEQEQEPLCQQALTHPRNSNTHEDNKAAPLAAASKAERVGGGGADTKAQRKGLSIEVGSRRVVQQPLRSIAESRQNTDSP